jgi:hypothetical protein
MFNKSGWFLAAVLIAIVVALMVRQRLSAQIVGNSALLFDFVTNQVGFDTGIAISNASYAKYGATERGGVCTFFYYGSTIGGGAPPAPQQTTTPIPPGGQVVFTISGGGTNGVTATPGFQGYVITVCNFPLARGVAFTTYGGQQLFAPRPATVIPAF